MTMIIPSPEVKAKQEAVLAVLREKFKNLPEVEDVMDGFTRMVGWIHDVSMLEKLADRAESCSSPDDFFRRMILVTT